MTTLSALDRLLNPVALLFSEEVAQRIATYQADAPTQSRLDELARRANDGQLRTEEQVEYEAYISAIDIISVLQAKARQRLRSQAAN